MQRTAGEYRADGCFVPDEIPDEQLVSSYDTSRHLAGAVIPVRLNNEAQPAVEQTEKAMPESPENKAVTKATETKKRERRRTPKE